MIVVSNTSPLTNLAAIGKFDLLQKLYREIYIPEAVWNELNAQGRQWPGRQEVAEAAWIKRQTVTDEPLVISLQLDLDRGEAESIGLALSLAAEWILLDETEGRRIARRLGLRPVGVLGILLQAKEHGWVEDVRPQLDALRQIAGFYVSEEVYQHVVTLAGE